jgi:MoaA/NifB/PqqE/SkfB family radical SAM enzyme
MIDQGICTLTTNGTLLDVGTVQRLQQAGVARVNVSWNSPGGDDLVRSQAASRGLRLLLDSTMQVGVNFLVTPTVLPYLPQALARLHSLGVRRVTILRPKPPAIVGTNTNATWYDSNELHCIDLVHLRAVLNAWQGVLALEVDSALVALMGDADPAHLQWRGIYGCTAGRRICTVWSDGRLTPCSFLWNQDAGKVHQMPFAELWRQGWRWDTVRNPIDSLHHREEPQCLFSPGPF